MERAAGQRRPLRQFFASEEERAREPRTGMLKVIASLF